jgi:hypothetical protein
MEERLAALEKRVADLEADAEGGWDADYSSFGPVDLYGDYGATQQPPSKPLSKKKMGAPPKMTQENFAHWRDNYVRWVEALWPELEEATSSPAEGDNELRDKLIRRFPAREGDRLFQALLTNVSGLRRYLASKSNTGQPRRIAYVLAGLAGGHAWSYSLERGRLNPSEERVHFRAMREHIKRHHPAWYSALTKESSQAKASATVPADCPECERFKLRPDRILPALEVRPIPPNESSKT